MLSHWEKIITKDFRKALWTPFLSAVRDYALLNEGDKIAVCLSGGKDSMLLAKLMQLLQVHSKISFQLEFIAMDPGYSPENLQKIQENCQILEIPVTFFSSEIFQDVENDGSRSPCYLCARKRRGCLYKQAQAMGCNKIALGHHFNDVVETTVLAMFYGSQLQAMIPKLKSHNFPGMELIRPMYCIHEEEIVRWKIANNLTFLTCECRIAKRTDSGTEASKRLEIKNLLHTLKQTHPDIEKCIFKSIHNLRLDTFPTWKHKEILHSFLDFY